MNYSCKTLHLFAFFCFFCLCISAANNYTSNFSLSSENKFLLNLEAHNYFKIMEGENILGGERGRMRGARRLLLGGPGSSPPRCAWKCGGCTPCKPVHVPVPPGTRLTTEYYPEAWRCKCGNKLYMP